MLTDVLKDLLAEFNPTKKDTPKQLRITNEKNLLKVFVISLKLKVIILFFIFQSFLNAQIGLEKN